MGGGLFFTFTRLSLYCRNGVPKVCLAHISFVHEIRCMVPDLLPGRPLGMWRLAQLSRSTPTSCSRRWLTERRGRCWHYSRYVVAFYLEHDVTAQQWSTHERRSKRDPSVSSPCQFVALEHDLKIWASSRELLAQGFPTEPAEVGSQAQDLSCSKPCFLSVQNSASAPASTFIIFARSRLAAA